MTQDIITYIIVLYAVTYTLVNTARLFIPEREKIKSHGCSACTGCSLERKCN